MVQSKRIGVEIAIASVVFGFILNLIGELTLSEVIAADPNSLGTGINIALQAVCTIVCGLIVMIPAMVAGSQLKGPGLFGGGQQY